MEVPNKGGMPSNEPITPTKIITPTASGVHTAKRPATRRFLDYTFADSPKTVAAKIGRDIVAPHLKSGVENALVAFIHGLLWNNGDARPTGLVAGNLLRPGGGTNYNGLTTLNPTGPLVGGPQPSSKYQDLVFPNQAMAENTLAQLYDLLNQYRRVAVGDLYEMSQMTPPVGSSSHGWTNLDSARITSTRDGFVLQLPKPTML